MRKLLIANRGEIARRVARTCRAMGIGAAVVFSEADRDAPFVREADEAAPLGGNTAGETYLHIAKLIAAAQRMGCDAVHPGYGFLAESAEFAGACRDAGLVFVGPSPESIAAMGRKVAAKQRMAAAGVPTLPSINATGRDAATLDAEAARLGWPVLVKASAGGGGRGMRLAASAAELAAAVEAGRREAASAFGDDAVFLEPYLDAPRHVEFQVFGDARGRVIHLFERECSIQRRHQKIIEESPSRAVDDKLRQAMGEAAVRAAAAVNYQGAGTVEFLLAPDGSFYFLEMNTRLQVEHPVTECVTGLDLVRLQLLVADGAPLPREAIEAELRGHAVEARLYAEDPRREFRPAIGVVERFLVPACEGVRVDAGVESGSCVSPYYDSLLAKVIASAPARGEAIRRLASALRQSRIHGVASNRDLLVRILEHPEFAAGATDTHFIARHDVERLALPLAGPDAERLHAAAAALAAQAERRGRAPVLRSIRSGWRNNASQMQETTLRSDSGERVVRYCFCREGVNVEVDGDPLDGVQLGKCGGEQVSLESAGVQRLFEVHRVRDAVYVDSALGASAFVEAPRFARAAAVAAGGSLAAPMPGVIVDVHVAVGQHVAAGDVLMTLESMKMLYPVAAPVAGRIVELRVAAQSHIDARAVLAVIEETK